MVNLQRITTTSVMRRGEVLGWEEVLEPEIQPQEQNTLEGIIFKEPLGFLLQLIHIPDEGRYIATSIRNGTLIILSYGSYMRQLSPGKTTAVYIMEFLVTKSICFGVVHLGNTEKDTTPYRSELMGDISGIVANQIIAKRWTVLE